MELAIGAVNRHFSMTDLGGAMNKVGMDGDGKKMRDTDCASTSIALAH